MATINKNYKFAEFPISIFRQGAFPLDANSVFYSLEEAKEYAKNNPTSYPGQIISVVDIGTNSTKNYQIEISGELSYISTNIQVDSELSLSSTNPVQNRIIYQALESAIANLQEQINRIIEGGESQEVIAVLIGDYIKFLKYSTFYNDSLVITTDKCTIEDGKLIIS